MPVSKTDPVTRARNAALRRARASLGRLVPDDVERESFTEAVDRYVSSVELGAMLRKEWAALGQPLITEGSMRQPIPHPLIKMIADTDRDAARYSSAIGLDPGAKVPKGHAGRPAGSASAPDRTAAPAKLRSVK